MEFAQLIEERRSIRKYKENTEISKETIYELIKAAQQAPSWKNSQTGRYYAVISQDKLLEVKENCLPAFNQNNCKNAPALIVTTFVKKRSGFEKDGSAVNELGDEWGAYDLGLQNENLILRAKDLGLDTLIMGIRDEVALRRILDIPESEEVVAVISLGYRDAEPEKPKRRELDEVVKIY